MSLVTGTPLPEAEPSTNQPAPFGYRVDGLPRVRAKYRVRRTLVHYTAARAKCLLLLTKFPAMGATELSNILDVSTGIVSTWKRIFHVQGPEALRDYKGTEAIAAVNGKHIPIKMHKDRSTRSMGPKSAEVRALLGESTAALAPKATAKAATAPALSTSSVLDATRASLRDHRRAIIEASNAAVRAAKDEVAQIDAALAALKKL